jgi:hypothetical protein
LVSIDVSGSHTVTLNIYGCNNLETVDASNCTGLTDVNGLVAAYGTYYFGVLKINALNVSGSLNMNNIQIYNCPNINLTLDASDYLSINLPYGSKSQANVDDILAKCLAIAPSIASHPALTLIGNSAPSAAGIIDKNLLIGTYGWTVTTA